MIDDIPSLIEEADKILAVPASLMGGESFVIPIDVFKRMRDALSRSAVSPLPEDRIKEAAALIAAEIGTDNLQQLQFREGASTSVILEDIAAKVLALAAPVSPLPEEIAGLLALREGLPEGPWKTIEAANGWWVVKSAVETGDDFTIARATEPVALAIAALPSLFALVEQQGRVIHTHELARHFVAKKHARETALTAPPLPEEIAGHIENLQNAADAHDARGNPVTAGKYRAGAGEREAEEQFRLGEQGNRPDLNQPPEVEAAEPTIPIIITVGHGRFHPGVKVSTVQGAIDRLADRCRELEAELETQAGRLQAAHKEVGAIGSKTIKECAALFEPPPRGWGNIDLHRARDRILALDRVPEAEAKGEE